MYKRKYNIRQYPLLLNDYLFLCLGIVSDVSNDFNLLRSVRFISYIQSNFSVCKSFCRMWAEDKLFWENGLSLESVSLSYEKMIEISWIVKYYKIYNMFLVLASTVQFLEDRLLPFLDF